jgi:hypothetical protein
MRTSKKNYLKQLTQIERRQARIRRIRSQLNSGKCSGLSDDSEFAPSPAARYQIGKSQNESVILPAFLQMHSRDPAVKVCKFSSCLSGSNKLVS